MTVAVRQQQQKPTRRLPPTHTKMGPASKPLMQLLNQRQAYAVPIAAIHFVSTTDEWRRCAERLRAAVVLGLDTETKPEFRKPPPGRKPNPCSLLQIATRDASGTEEVFVLDLLVLPPKLYNAALADVFLSKRVLKLGQGFYHDLKELALSYPSATCFHVAKHVVELNDLSISLLGGGGHLPLSLQKLVFLYLNRKLTKTQQTSNWNRRPLAAGQLHYAAADALVLIHLYDELTKRMALARPDFQVESVANVLDVHVSPAPKCNLCFCSFASADVLKAHRKECVATVHTLEICAGCDETPLETTEAMRQHLSECHRDVASDDSSCVVARLVPRAQPEKKKKAKGEKQVAATAAAATATTSVRSRKRSHSESAATSEASTASKRAELLKPATQTPEVTKKQAKRQRQREKKLLAQCIKAAEVMAVADQPASPAPPGAAESATADASESKRARKRRRQQERTKSKTTVAQQQHGARTPTRKMSVESSLLASDAIWSQVSTDYSSSLFSP